MTQDELLTAKEAALILKVDPRTIKMYIREGRLKAGRHPNDYRIRRSELDLFIKRGELRTYCQYRQNLWCKEADAPCPLEAKDGECYFEAEWTK